MKKLLLILCLTSMTAFGGVMTDYKVEVAQIERTYENNVEKGSSTLGMSRAKKEMYDSYDLLLNKYYKELMAILTPEQKKSLKESQREWIKYRDKELEFLKELYSNKEGTIWGLFYSDNKLRILKDRVDELVQYLSLEKDGME